MADSEPIITIASAQNPDNLAMVYISNIRYDIKGHLCGDVKIGEDDNFRNIYKKVYLRFYTTRGGLDIYRFNLDGQTFELTVTAGVLRSRR